jgi:hypothetical protein
MNHVTIKRTQMCGTVAAFVFAATAGAAVVFAQQPAPPAQTVAAATKPMTFKVEVKLTRMDGDKLLGVSPFSLIVTGTHNVASLRVGVDVPIGTVTSASGHSELGFKTIGTQIDSFVAPFEEARYAVQVSINDTAVFSDGTEQAKLDAAEVELANAEREVARQKELRDKNLTTQATLNQAESRLRTASVNAAATAKAVKAGVPEGTSDRMAFRTFTSSNLLYLRDGQTQEMTMATDRTSGETIKAAVTLTVIR